MKSWAMILATAVGAFAQVPEYLPLQVGNQWIYKGTTGPNASLASNEVLSIPRQETVGGRTYFVLTGLSGQEPWLRYASDGVLVNYDRETRTERPYLDFTTPVGRTLPTSGHPCHTTAEIQDKSYKGSFPLGEFGNVLQVRYTGNTCADAGLTADYYLPYIGLLRRAETTLAGARVYDLIYARINGTVMISAGETSFSLSTDKAAYLNTTSEIPVMSANLTLRHSDSTDPLTLQFSSGQEFDYILSDSTGKVIYQFSSTATFIQATHTLTIAKEHNWPLRIPLRGADGRVLPGGTYKLEGFLTTAGGVRYRAMVTIEVAEIRPANQ